jgi:hypothetical protein
MIEALLLVSIFSASPSPSPPVVHPNPVPSPIYTPPSPPAESWSDKMWRRYQENRK